MPRRNPGASSRVIAANLGCISSGLGAGGGRENNPSLSPPCARRISCGSGFASAGEGGERWRVRREAGGGGRAQEPRARRAGGPRAPPGTPRPGRRPCPRRAAPRSLPALIRINSALRRVVGKKEEKKINKKKEEARRAGG